MAVKAIIQPLSMVYIDSIFRHVYGLIDDEDVQAFENLPNPNDQREVIFHDKVLKNPCCVKALEAATAGKYHSSIHELVAYVNTHHGKIKTIRHQIVAPAMFTLHGRNYFSAVGRHNEKMALYILPEAKSKETWPTSAIFLKYQPAKT